MATRRNPETPLIAVGIFLAGALLLTGGIIAGNGVLVVVAVLLVLLTGTFAAAPPRR